MGNGTAIETGSCGSVFQSVRIDPYFIPQAAQMDWNRMGRRVVLDAVRGIVSWMSPSRLHEKITHAAEKTVELVSDFCGTEISDCFGSGRWKKPEDPPGTGMEADTAFYIGKNACLYIEACDAGEDEVFEDRTPPDLVIEAEAFHSDVGKPRRWAALGVTEMWRLEKGKTRLDPPKAEILGLQPEVRRLSRSLLLPALTPDTISKAVHLSCRRRTEEMEGLLRQVSAPPPPDDDEPGF